MNIGVKERDQEAGHRLEDDEVEAETEEVGVKKRTNEVEVEKGKEKEKEKDEVEEAETNHLVGHEEIVKDHRKLKILSEVKLIIRILIKMNNKENWKF